MTFRRLQAATALAALILMMCGCSTTRQPEPMTPEATVVEVGCPELPEHRREVPGDFSAEDIPVFPGLPEGVSEWDEKSQADAIMAAYLAGARAFGLLAVRYFGLHDWAKNDAGVPDSSQQ